MPKPSPVTEAAQRRVNRELARHKGETLEALEHILRVVGSAVDYLREDNADVCLTPRLLAALHDAHTRFGKLFSAQHRARAFKDVLRIINE